MSANTIKIMDNIKTGKIGENIAFRYLLNKNYLILSRNYKEKHDEIDIIALTPGNLLIFCEVKTINKNNSGFMPEDNLNWAKRKKMVRAARMFLLRHPKLASRQSGWQLDLIAIVLDGEKTFSLRHYENI